ncbi:MurR/RpiR family transcriptional regulator [Ornithinimicrobium tianjinense]|uniref:Sugar isomerase n=1 Tax=Ornithinimicrobium tianjinense TaxID=1195761 RepID=A0A917FAY9_9MICO|nr:MurR/RpiR family transcriptional regulator [Ornithinimicrobium tianjinense]GGF58676.1 sugar isomerase [Ornithinimicrobium tianjinense]
MSEPTVATLIRETMGDLPAAERKAARALLSAYPVAGLETVAALAQRAGVSAPTVVRFVSRLGFSGYPAFQRSLMREVHAQLGSPLQQYPSKGHVAAGEDLLPYVVRAFASSLQTSFDEVPQSEFERAVDLLCDPQHRVHVVGGRFSHVLADYLVSHLQLLRPGVHSVPGDEFSRVALVGGAGRDDLLVVFDYRRYDPATVRLATQAARAGAQVLLLTDPWLSPVSEVATAVLPTHVESPSPFDSLVPAFALVEALVAGITEQLGETGRARVERLEQVREELDPHTPSALAPPD